MNDTKVEGGIRPANLARDVNDTKVEGSIGPANLAGVLMIQR